MTKRDTGSKGCDPLPLIAVGSGITKRKRKQTIFDSPHREKFLSGDEIDARVRLKAIPSSRTTTISQAF